MARPRAGDRPSLGAVAALGVAASADSLLMSVRADGVLGAQAGDKGDEPVVPRPFRLFGEQHAPWLDGRAFTQSVAAKRIYTRALCPWFGRRRADDCDEITVLPCGNLLRAVGRITCVGRPVRDEKAPRTDRGTEANVTSANDDMCDIGINRRVFVAGAGSTVMGLGLLTAACGASGGTATPGNPTAPASANGGATPTSAEAATPTAGAGPSSTAAAKPAVKRGRRWAKRRRCPSAEAQSSPLRRSSSRSHRLAGMSACQRFAHTQVVSWVTWRAGRSTVRVTAVATTWTERWPGGPRPEH